MLKNLGDQEFRIEKNMRIAQMLIQPVITADITEVEEEHELGDTIRGEQGFGSSGNK